jgi:predicted aspartyl protease
VRQTTTVASTVFRRMRPKQGFNETKATQRSVVYVPLAAVFFFSVGTTKQADAACQLLQIGELPVAMLNNSPVIPASINGHAVQLLADTGAANSVIWRSAAQELRLEIIQSNTTFYGAGGADAAGVVTVRDFGIAGGTIHNVHLYAAGRGASPGNSAGVLGEDVLSHWDIEFDLSAGKIRLFMPKNCNGDQVVYWAQSYFMTKLIGAPGNTNWLETNVILNGHEVLGMFDSGAALSTVTTQALRQTGINAEVSPVTSTATRGLAGKSIDTATAVFPTLTIGQESFQNVKLRIADLFGKNTETTLGSLISHSVIDNPDMIIGADFFMAHRIYVARSQGKIYFTYKGGPVFQHLVVNPPAPSGEAGAADATTQ